MNVKKMIFLLLCFYAGIQIHAQKKLYYFSFEGNSGLTDSLKAELVPPIYDWYQVSKDKKLYVSRPKSSSEGTILIYNTVSGETNTSYESIYLDNAFIDNQYYHYFNTGKNVFLQNAETMSVLQIPVKAFYFEDFGNHFIFSKFSPEASDFPKPATPKAKPTKIKPIIKKKSTGKVPPPSIMHDLETITEERYDPYLNSYVFYSDSLPLKTILKIQAHNYLKLFVAKDELKAAVEENIIIYNESGFDYVAFKKEDQLFLHDKNLVLLKKLGYTKKEDGDKIDGEYIGDLVTKFLGKKVSTFKSYPPSPGIYVDDPKKRVQDPFIIEKTNEGIYQLRRTADEKVCFSTIFKMRYDNANKRVTVANNEEKFSRFHIDASTGEPFLPKKYLDLLLIKINSK